MSAVDDIHATLIAELVNSDNQLAPTLRAVFESGQQETFFEALQKYVSNSENEIEKMCNYHYQDFINSVNELAAVRDQSFSMSSELKEIDVEFQATGNRQLELASELMEHRVMLRNIALSIEALDACLPVLKTYGKVMQHFNAKRYYQALRALGQMEVFLPKVQGLSISDLIQNSIPAVRDAIKNAVRSDLQDWMEEVMTTKSREIGEVVMEHTKKMQLDKKDIMFDYYSGDDLQISHIVDYTPVYRCLHVFSVLSCRGEVESFYIDARRKQVNLILENNSSVSQNRVDGLFSKVLGFFIVEDTVLNTTENLISRATLDELWKVALDKIVQSAIQTELDKCRQKTQLLELKQTIEIFCIAVAGYQYSVKRLNSIFQNVKERYDHILIHESRLLIENILKKDDFKQLVINDQTTWNKIIVPLELQDKKWEEKKFPRKLPFSATIPKLFFALKNFLDSSMQFSDELNIIEKNSVDLFVNTIEKLCQSQIQPIVTQMLEARIKAAVESCNLLDMGKFEQSVRAATSFSGSVRCLPQILGGIFSYIKRKTVNVNRSSSPVVMAMENRFKSFQEIRKTVDAGMIKLLKSLVDSFLRKASYNWCPEEPDNMPSKHINDMITRMSITFGPFERLPKSVVKEAYSGACYLMADRLLSLITELRSGSNQRERAATRMTNKIFPKLELDIILCEGFADSCEITGLRGYFKEVKQLVSLVLSNGFNEYLNAKGRGQRYDSLKPHTVVACLERLCIEDGVAGGITRFFGGDKEVKKYETVLNQLMSLK